MAGSEYDPIKEIECRIPYKKEEEKPRAAKQHNVKMNFFSDSRFSQKFDSFLKEEGQNVLFLVGSKVGCYSFDFFKSYSISTNFQKLKTNMRMKKNNN